MKINLTRVRVNFIKICMLYYHIKLILVQKVIKSNICMALKQFGH